MWTTKSGLYEPAEGKQPSSRGVQTVLLIRSLAGRLTELSYLTIHCKLNTPVLNKQKEMHLLQFSVKSSPYSYPVTAGLKKWWVILYLISPVSFFIVHRNIFPGLWKQFLSLIQKALKCKHVKLLCSVQYWNKSSSNDGSYSSHPPAGFLPLQATVIIADSYFAGIGPFMWHYMPFLKIFKCRRVSSGTGFTNTLESIIF